MKILQYNRNNNIYIVFFLQYIHDVDMFECLYYYFLSPLWIINRFHSTLYVEPRGQMIQKRKKSQRCFWLQFLSILEYFYLQKNGVHIQLDASCNTVQFIIKEIIYIHRTQNANIKKQNIIPKSLIGDDPQIDNYSW